MRKKLHLLLIIGAINTATFAQNIGINSDGSLPDASAMLDVKSTTKGVLVPRMTTAERGAIVTPAQGLLVFDNTTSSFWYFDGVIWVEVTPTGADGNGIYDGDGTTPAGTDVTVTDYINIDANTLFVDAANNRIGIGTASPQKELHIVSNAYNSGIGVGENNNLDMVVIGYDPTNDYGSIQSFDGGAADNLSINPIGGNVGIGTTAPSEKLEVSGNLALRNPGGYGEIYGWDRNHMIVLRGDRTGVGSDKSSYYQYGGTLASGNGHRFYTGGVVASQTERMHIADDGIRMSSLAGAGSRMVVADATGTLSSQAIPTGGDNVDTDGDTQIQVEESADDDKIRFDLEGTEQYIMEKNASGVSRISTPTVGANDQFGSIHIGYDNGINATSPQSLNVGIGSYALRALTSGAGNVAIGNYSLGVVNTGTYNMAMGYQALGTTSSGSGNIGIGEGAGGFNTTGSFNTYLGNYARTSGAAFTNSSAIGNRAYVEQSNSMVLGSINGVNGATSDVNIGIGTTTPSDKLHVVGTSGNTLRIVDGNQAAGRVLTSAADGSASWAVPAAGAVDELVDADADTKIQVEESADEDKIRFDLGGTEFYSMEENVNGISTLNVDNNQGNVFMGVDVALNADYTNSRWNVGIGDLALQNLTSGYHNLGMGFAALQSLTSGTYNIGLIAGSGMGITSGNGNFAAGELALQLNQTGNNNIAIGQQAIRQTRGSGNIGIGQFAGRGVLAGFTGTGLTIIGHNAVSTTNFNASNITAYGYQAGANVTTGGNNTFVGYQSGDANTTGSSNTALGYLSDVGAAVTNATAIGANTTASQSNSVILGNSADVGIGTTTPTTLINAVKSQNAQTAMLMENLTAGANSSVEYQLKNDASEYTKLGIFSSASNVYGALSPNNGYIYTGSTAFTIMADDVAGVIKFATGGNSERMRLDASGNLGIGTTGPSAKLDVVGTTELNGAVAIIDGTQGAGKVLTSDASGNASWGKAPAVYMQSSTAACNSSNESGTYCTIITQNFTTTAASSTVVLDFNGAYGSGACSNVNAGGRMILNGTNVRDANYVSNFAGNYSSVSLPLKHVATVAAGNHTVEIRIYKMWNTECQLNNLADGVLITTVYE